MQEHTPDLTITNDGPSNSHDFISTKDLHKLEIKEVTQEFFQECKNLSSGQLAKSSAFHLGEAMSAIEIMDPKMDAGMTPMEKDLGLESAIKTGKLNVKNMPLMEMIATMDATLSAIVTWLQGQSLDQTVYTNICLHNVDLIEDSVLRVFSRAALHFVSIFKFVIQMAAVFNEEDFNGTSLVENLIKPSSDTAPVFNQLKTVENEIQKRIRSKTESTPHLEAIYARVHFLRHLLDVCRNLLPPMNAYSQTTDSKFTPKFQEASKLLANCRESLKKIESSINLGLHPKNDAADEGDFSWLPAFQPSVNRQFLPPTFPRESKMIPRVESILYLKGVLAKLENIVNDLPESISNIEHILKFIRRFSEDSCILSRSILQLVLLPYDDCIFGEHPLSQIISDSIQLFSSPAILDQNTPLYNHEDCQALWKDFLMLNVRSFLSVIQLFGHNLTRQRDKITGAIEELSVLQTEAEKADTTFEAFLLRHNYNAYRKPVALSAFVLYHILQLMHYYWSLTFKLELLVPYEYAYSYWYFGEVVTKWMRSMIERSTNFIMAEYSNASKDKKKADRKKAYKLKKDAQIRHRINELQGMMIYHRAETHLSAAYFHVCAGLMASKNLVVPEGESVRYRQRISPFLSIAGPLMVPYMQYLRASKIDYWKTMGADKCFLAAEEAFMMSRTELLNLESIEEYKQLVPTMLKTCKQNAVISKLLASKKIDKDIVFDFSSSDHWMFPLLKLT